MDKISVKDLTKILKSCKELGVSELKFGNLSVVFGEKTMPQPLTSSVRQTKAAEIQTQVVEKEALQQLSKELDEEELSVMSIENPEMFEQLLIEKELGDERSDTAGTEVAQH